MEVELQSILYTLAATVPTWRLAAIALLFMVVVGSLSLAYGVLFDDEDV